MKRTTCVVITASRGRRNPGIYDPLVHYVEADLAIFENTMKAIVTNPVVHTIVMGGASSDTIALIYALKHRLGEYPKLWVVVPATLKMQPRETWYHSRQADRLIEMDQQTHDDYGKFRKIIYINRNRKMLEIAQEFENYWVQAFWTGQRSHSGTYSTIAMAKREFECMVQIAWIGNARNQKPITDWVNT
jgi:hypothetical protein